jgi:hypothetical protein
MGRRFSAAVDVSRYESTGLERIEETRTELRFIYSPSDSAARALAWVGR